MQFRLLQARRPDDPVKEEERLAFAARLAVHPDRVIAHDLLHDDLSLDRLTDGVDAVLVGGAGEFSVNDPYPWIGDFVDALGELSAARFPTFASCFGFQGLVLALGGKVDKLGDHRAEVGTFHVELLDHAHADPLFEGLPKAFTAQLGHKDHATDWPESATVLARSERCEYQALVTGGGRIYATQFHPELTHDDNLLRFQRYEVHYIEAFGVDRYHRMVDGFQPSPHASSLLGRFRELLQRDFAEE